MRGLAIIAAAALASAGCTPAEEALVTAYDGIGAGETISLGGTEPFWGISIAGDGPTYTLTYSTPDNIEGDSAEVTRFAGNGGLSFSGTLSGEAITAAITPGECTDGMSDRTYPFTATVQLGEDLLTGCGHTDKQPYTGIE